jgi:foldase protein PrsA
MVEADIEARIREQTLMYAVIDKEIRSKIIIKPAEITDFYQANTKLFVLPEQWEFQSMALNSESLANEVTKQYKDGQTLEDIGNKYSIMIDTFRSVRGGQLRKDIEEVLFRLKIDQVSNPIKIENSYYIFRLNSVIPPRQQNLIEVQNDIQAMLYNKKMQEALTKWLDKLKAQSYIKIL